MFWTQVDLFFITHFRHPSSCSAIIQPCPQEPLGCTRQGCRPKLNGSRQQRLRASCSHPVICYFFAAVSVPWLLRFVYACGMSDANHLQGTKTQVQPVPFGGSPTPRYDPKELRHFLPTWIRKGLKFSYKPDFLDLGKTQRVIQQGPACSWFPVLLLLLLKDV